MMIEFRRLKIFILLFVLNFSTCIYAQKVSHVRAEQLGQDVLVFYKLDALSACEVILLCSIDNGVTWSMPLSMVKGDIGDNILPGEKRIFWRVLDEREKLVGDEIKFKVIANPAKRCVSIKIRCEGVNELELLLNGFCRVLEVYGINEELSTHPFDEEKIREVIEGEIGVINFSFVCDHYVYSTVVKDAEIIEIVDEYLLRLHYKDESRVDGLGQIDFYNRKVKNGKNEEPVESTVIWNNETLFDLRDRAVLMKNSKEFDHLEVILMQLFEYSGLEFNLDSFTNEATFVFCDETDFWSKEILEPEMLFVKGSNNVTNANFNDFGDRFICDSEVNSFGIGKYEVTQAQWIAVMGSNPCYFDECYSCPVIFLEHNQIREFIRKLNLITGKNYRLPTECEWEYAAKGGELSKGFRYSGSDSIESVAWYHNNSGDAGFIDLNKVKLNCHPIGLKAPNELGIYDMTGNASEVCFKQIGLNYWEADNLVIRGGSCSDVENDCHILTRENQKSLPAHAGFRLVLEGD